MDILTELKLAISDAAQIPLESLPDDVPLESLGISSIEVMSAYVWLERVLEVSFTGNDLNYQPSSTLTEVAAAIEKTVANR